MTRFEELSYRTEMQMVKLIHKELDLGIGAARQAVASLDNTLLTEEYRGVANRVFVHVSRLLPLLRGVGEGNGDPLELRMRSLRQMLDALSAVGSGAAPSKDSIASLAQILWDSRGRPEGRAEEDWFRAEEALKSRSESHAASAR